MKQDEAFATIRAGFATAGFDIETRRKRWSFTAIASNSAEYLIEVRWGKRDPLTDNPESMSVHVTQGGQPYVKSGKAALSHAETLASTTVATIRDTGYLVQERMI